MPVKRGPALAVVAIGFLIGAVLVRFAASAATRMQVSSTDGSAFLVRATVTQDQLMWAIMISIATMGAVSVASWYLFSRCRARVAGIFGVGTLLLLTYSTAKLFAAW
jgi:hypothetical protein